MSSVDTMKRRWPTWLAYVGMVIATVLLLAVVLSYGGRLNAGLGTGPGLPPASASSAFSLVQVLLAIVVIVAAASALGGTCARIGQPRVAGEIVAGIALGPSVLGAIAPAIEARLFPASVAPSLGLIAQLGAVFFMFLVGLELDAKLLRENLQSALAISHASIVAPLILGVTVSLYLYPTLAGSQVPFTTFALFMGVAMSITAFPVLARILTDRGAHKSRLGILALSCAAVDDITAWCLLAFVVSLAATTAIPPLLTLSLTLSYLAGVWLIVRPVVQGYVRRQELKQDAGHGKLTVIFIGLLASAVCTEMIGIHAIFGAFLAGAVVPHGSRVAKELHARLSELVSTVFLPVFFAYTGLRTEVGLMSGWSQWSMCCLLIFVACAGKLGGTYAAARFAGLGRADSMSLGALMNTRGLMELVVLNIGLDLGVISPTLFAMMVLMAIVTTLSTTPLLAVVGWVSRAQTGMTSVGQS